MASIKKLRIGSTEYDLGGSTDINVTVQAVTNQTLTVDVIYPTGITAGSKVNVGTPTLKIALTEAPGYSTGSITINGTDTKKTTYLAAAVDGMIIGATDATLLDKKPLIFSMVDSYVKGEDEATPTVSINPDVFTGDLYCSHENDQTKAEKMEAGVAYEITPPLYVWSGETFSTSEYNQKSFFGFSTKGVKVSGNVSALFNFEKTEYLNLPRAFSGCREIIDASELDFSDLEGLKSKTYYGALSGFFSLCTNLVTPPKALPDIIQYQYDFASMFYGCSSLQTPPALPPRLAPYSYYAMFKNCTSLTKAPDLPLDNLPQNCYANMFEGCTSLETAPELPAENIGIMCYEYMFSGCTSLNTPPKLPAKKVFSSCYEYMFQGCTSLVTAPELPSESTESRCYGRMFKGCTSLKVPPKLPAKSLNGSCYLEMFHECSSLEEAPELPAEVLSSECYRWMFWDCPSLKYVKCLAKEGVNSTNLSNWLNSVNKTGTFVKSAGVEFPSGSSGIPSGWTVEEV